VFALLVLAVLAYFLWQKNEQREAIAPSPAAPAAAVPSPAEAPPAINHPIEQARGTVPPSVEQKPLPALMVSDTTMQNTLADLFGSATLGRIFYEDAIVHRFVATVDNLPRKTLPLRYLPVKPPGGTFVTTGSDDALATGADNAARYTPYVRLVDAVDAKTLAGIYVHFYPLMQQDYRALGYPSGYFNDRLVQAIDDLLAAPDLTAPPALAQPKVLYVYTDPELESRSAGQKIMMRMGSENAARVKAKLRENARRSPHPATRISGKNSAGRFAYRSGDTMTTARLLARRKALALLGASGAALLVARYGAAAPADPSLPACVVRPRQTEGPFFVDGDLERSDLRIDPRTGAAKPGMPLRLAFRVSRVGASVCAPLAGAQVHVWHCDAAGNYSSVRDRRAPNAGEAFLRGFQNDGCGGDGAVSDHLSGLVSGTRGARALQDPHRRRAAWRRVHFTALFRRCTQRAGLRYSALCGPGSAKARQRRRLPVSRRRQAAPAGRHAGKRRLRRRVRHRSASLVIDHTRR
jgi:hypothetical protein